MERNTETMKEKPKDVLTEKGYPVQTATPKRNAAVSDCFRKYLESRGVYHHSARELVMRSNKEEALCIFQTKSGDTAEKLKDLLEKAGISCFSCKFKGNEESEKYGVIFGNKDEAEAVEIREKFLVMQKVKFQTERRVLEAFSKVKKLDIVPNLSYAEILAMRERAHHNGIMFHIQPESDHSFSLYTRSEDHKKVQVLLSGIQMERQGTGKNIYEHENITHKRLSDAWNMSFANPQKTFDMENVDGNKHLRIGPNGFYYEDAGKKLGDVFVSKESAEYERKMVEHIKMMKGTRLVFDEQTKRRMENVVEEPKNIQESLTDRKKKEAYSMLRRSIDLYRTKEEERTRDRPSYDERVQFDAEHEIRLNYEFMLIHGSFAEKNMAEQYIRGAIPKEDMEIYTHEDISDIRCSIDWRMPYAVPAYLDKNNDKILDDFQEEMHHDIQIQKPMNGYEKG